MEKGPVLHIRSSLWLVYGRTGSCWTVPPTDDETGGRLEGITLESKHAGRTWLDSLFFPGPDPD